MRAYILHNTSGRLLLWLLFNTFNKLLLLHQIYQDIKTLIATTHQSSICNEQIENRITLQIYDTNKTPSTKVSPNIMLKIKLEHNFASFHHVESVAWAVHTVNLMSDHYMSSSQVKLTTQRFVSQLSLSLRVNLNRAT